MSNLEGDSEDGLKGFKRLFYLILFNYQFVFHHFLSSTNREILKTLAAEIIIVRNYNLKKAGPE